MAFLYWTTTLLFSIFLFISAYSYIFSATTIEGIKALGFPDFFRIQLAVLKTIAALVLLIPAIPNFIKEWSYVGSALFLITALVAHIAHKDSIFISVLLIILFVVLSFSYFSFHKLQ
ncbi:DoxX family protein [Tenacibaculum jejuense]|uniref:DoxX-like family protein n=1 Tax=Tenacibaculum jejuense TaxID=584609 RepID=A0A238UC73_9FLAO|nr:DoxX family protein [Tenacibaculum jejuense]SNR16692.1 DoxX-like family protein [Tenacibaculum jejuense]